MKDLKSACEQSFYEELYHIDSAGKTDLTIVRDTVSGQVYMRKTLSVYNIAVIEYLRTHRNPHIPAVTRYWEQDGKLTVIEELVQGVTLDVLMQRGTLSEQERIRILQEVCEGLRFLHAADPPIIHRDIKESNIMVTDSGLVKVIDFDAARKIVPTAARDTELFGTHGNAAPEQYGFAQSDARTDIYALGAMMQRMFPDNKIMRRIADRATAIDPDKRYQSVNQMLREIRRRSGKRSNYILPAVIVGAVVSVALIALLANRVILWSRQLYHAAGTDSPQNGSQLVPETENSMQDDSVQDTEIPDSHSAVQKPDTMTGEPVADGEHEPLQLVDSGYYITWNGEEYVIEYAYEVFNPNPGVAAEMVAVNAIAKDTQGQILGINEDVLCGVPAGEHVVHSGFINYNGDEKPAELTVTIESVLLFTPQENAMCLASTQFDVSDITRLKDSGGLVKYVGEITNNSSQESMFAVTVVYTLNGEMIGGETTFTDVIKAGGSRTFELWTYSEPAQYDAYQVYVKSW